MNREVQTRLTWVTLFEQVGDAGLVCRRCGISRPTLRKWALAHRAAPHWTYVSDLERARQTPTLDVVNRLARGLDITVAAFFAPFDTRYRRRARRPRSDQT